MVLLVFANNKVVGYQVVFLDAGQGTKAALPPRHQSRDFYSKPNSLIRGDSILTGSAANSRLGSVSSLTLNSRLGSVSSLTLSSTARNS